MVEYLPSADGNVIGYLQEAKNNHMVELAEKLTKNDCELYFEHYNFACLKRDCRMMLSPIQKEIVETSGNLIVRASAGTGKTHTMVSKIMHDIEENHTHKVVAAITFTIKPLPKLKNV